MTDGPVYKWLYIQILKEVDFDIIKYWHSHFVGFDGACWGNLGFIKCIWTLASQRNRNKLDVLV